MKKENNGYILILTLMMLSLLVIVVSSMFFNETAHSALSRTMIDREKAKMLALGGVQLALSKLTIPEKEKKDKQEKETKATAGPESKDKKEKEENKPENKNEAAFLRRILPFINQWQTIKINADTDGIDGQIKFCLCSESGKINVNQFYDFAKHKFIGERAAIPEKINLTTATKEFNSREFLQEFSKKISQITTEKDFFPGLQKFLQNRKFPLNDATELLEIPEFSYFQNRVFLTPQANEEKKSQIYLTDIFTTWTDSNKIQPWLLSESNAAILGLNKVQFNDGANKDKTIDNWISKFKPQSQWQTDWDKILKPVYGKEFGILIKGIENLFDSQFGSKVFSVLSYGTVGQVTQRVFAILEIEGDPAIAQLKKLYWI